MSCISSLFPELLYFDNIYPITDGCIFCGIAYSVIHSPTFGSISRIWSNLFSSGSAKSSATTEYFFWFPVATTTTLSGSFSPFPISTILFNTNVYTKL